MVQRKILNLQPEEVNAHDHKRLIPILLVTEMGDIKMVNMLFRQRWLMINVQYNIGFTALRLW